MKPRLYTREALEAEARKHASWCEIVIADQVPQLDEGYAFAFDQKGLGLVMPGYPKPFRLSIKELERRGRGKTLLRRACGARDGLKVLDPFAGFGMDAMHLAGAGCIVTTVEQHLAPWLLCREFAARAEITLDMHLGHARNWLHAGYDVVYLDPMFGPRAKSDLPSLALQHLRKLSGPYSGDLDALVTLARRVATQRVVLKRRLHDPLLGKPGFQIKGRSVRFDVYPGSASEDTA